MSYHDEDRYSNDEAGAADFERHRDYEPPEYDDLSDEHREALLDPEIRAMIEGCFEPPEWSDHATWEEPF